MSKNTVKLLSAILVLIMISGVCVFASGDGECVNPYLARVVDGASVLDESERENLESIIGGIREKYKFDIVIVTTTDLGGKNEMEYADDYYDYTGYGYGSDYDGCLLLLYLGEYNAYWISTEGYGIKAINDRDISNLGEDIVSDLASGNYYDAFRTFSYDVRDLVSESKNGSGKSSSGMNLESLPANLGIGAVVGLIIALIVISVLKAQLKSVRPQPSAGDYFVNGSLMLTGSYDRFVGSYVTRVRIKDDSSSGSSSTHRSSSGRVHGGGGGRF